MHNSLKYLLVCLMLFFLCIQSHEVNAQRFAYVDTEYILENVPEYKQARQQLKVRTEEWRDEIRRMQSELSNLKSEYEAEKVLLPDEVREQRKQEVQDKEKEIAEYREEKFGRQGQLYSLRDELLRPVQDRVFDAVQEMARESALDFVFDRAGSVSMLYYSTRHDRSDEVLKHMGIDPPDQRDDDKPDEPGDRDEIDEPDDQPERRRPGRRPSPGRDN